MKQVLQSLRDGRTELSEVPAPAVRPGHLLIRTRCSVVSAGTERMLVEFGKANWLDKARQQPDKVRMVLDKVRTDGLRTTVEAVRSKLDQPLAPGYCNVGEVIAVGQRVESFQVGDRVASNGAHAEVVCVPGNLCARVPDAVRDEDAAFTVLGAIALQGLRLAQPTLGECVVVTGLGLVGLATVQMLRAHGCRVLGIDPDPARRQLAEQFGAQSIDSSDGDAIAARAAAFSRGRGVDAVLITASTRSNQPVHQAAQMCRKRGRIILVGVTGLELSRADFYAKELQFQVSCSYGPGRYDPSYEEQGHDYPVGFVRWTEQRNFEAVLDLMDSNTLNFSALVSHRFPLCQATTAYHHLTDGQGALGIVLQYPQEASVETSEPARTVAVEPAAAPVKGTLQLAFFGAGNYAGRTLMPAFRKSGAALHTVVSAGGVSASHQARKHGFAQASSDAQSVLDDPAIDAVVIATRHNLHATQVMSALAAGKPVFCEKPLCLHHAELARIAEFFHDTESPSPQLMVGFNRRFAPHVRQIRALLEPMKVPAQFVMTVNAGAIEPDHWTQDPSIGGGRIIGEACHFIDLLRHLAGAPVESFQAQALSETGGPPTSDNATIQLAFANGSRGTVHYFANGHKGFPKERLEIFCAGRVLQLDNFRRLHGWGWPGLKPRRLWRQDKGQNDCAAAFVDAIGKGSPAPIPLAEILEVSRVTLAVSQQLQHAD